MIAGKVDLEELISAFKDLGLEVDVDEARKLLGRCFKYFSIGQQILTEPLLSSYAFTEWTRMAA